MHVHAHFKAHGLYKKEVLFTHAYDTMIWSCWAIDCLYLCGRKPPWSAHKRHRKQCMDKPFHSATTHN